MGRARKGPKRHVKRLAAPYAWPIPRKEGGRFAPRPYPGPHTMDTSVPLLILVRDILGYADYAREARKIITRGEIYVDGVPRKEPKYPVGIMDVVEIPRVDERYRVIMNEHHRIDVVPIDEDEARIKVCKIKNKTYVKGGNLQVTLHDGKNFLVEIEDPTDPKEDVYSVGDSVVLRLPEPDEDGRWEVEDHIPFEEGVWVYATTGRHSGETGKVVEIQTFEGPEEDLVTVENEEGDRFQTTADRLIAIGRDEPLVTVKREEG
ncbi:MAG: 30S ribosomal protein S4e [Methanopyri archaeon]|nr:30S ribosomal protein S4e [Methanopyri archaeon]